MAGNLRTIDAMQIQKSIYNIRGKRVMLDRNLAAL
jgi:hypothetical protein